MRRKVQANPILDRVRTLTLQTAATLKKELQNIEDEKRRLVAGFTDAAGHIMETLRRLGHSSNDGSVATPAGPRTRRRVRRGPEQLKRDAEAIIQFVRGKGTQGAKGADIRKKHPKVGPDIKGFVQKHSGRKLKTTGVKATMRYFVG